MICKYYIYIISTSQLNINLMEADFTPTHLLSYFSMLFILFEVVETRNKSSMFGISCFKNSFSKRFVFLDLEAVERCQMASLERCLFVEEGRCGRGILGFPRSPA